MESSKRDPSMIQPAITLLSIIIIGVVIAVYIVKNEALRAPIIITSVIIAFIITILELKTLSTSSNNSVHSPKMKKQRFKTAKYVADLFDEDIPFDEIEEEEERNEALR